MLLLFALYASGPAPAFAEFSAGPFSFSAFGTLGGAVLTNPHADYAQGTQPTGPGLKHPFDMGLDSRLGAQINAALTSSTLITVQSVLERLPDNQFLPRLSQLNIRQEIGENLAIRVGRIQNPAFLASDYRLANFSNPWVRTPGMVYNIFPLTHLDSAEFSYWQDTGLGRLGLNAGYGWVKYPFPSLANQNSPDASAIGELDTVNVRISDVLYANLKLDNGPWRLKLAWMHGLISADFNDLDDLFVLGGARIDPAVLAQVNTTNMGTSLYSAGLSYDSPDWLLMAEWGMSLSDHAEVLDDKHGGYLTLGYHLGRWLPQITIGYQATIDKRIHSFDAMTDAIFARIHNQERTDYRTVAAGLNYAVTDSIMLRGQVDLIQPMRFSTGPYFQADPNFNIRNPGVDALFSLSLDFIY